MVFEKLTLFEIRLDDARFSNKIGSESDDEHEVETESTEMETSEMETSEAESASGGSRIRRVAGLAVVGVVVGTLAARRLRGRDDATTVELEGEDDVELVA